MFAMNNIARLAFEFLLALLFNKTHSNVARIGGPRELPHTCLIDAKRKQANLQPLSATVNRGDAGRDSKKLHV